MATTVLEYAPAGSSGTPAGQGTQRRITAFVAIGGGLLALVAMVVGLGSSPAGSRSGETIVTSNAAAAPSFPDVGTSDGTYQPGHSSGWHTHPGLHSVVVLTGTLTIYDAACARHDFGPGETYLGGREPHLATNETESAVQLVVTYVFAMSSPLDHATVVPAPAGCSAA